MKGHVNMSSYVDVEPSKVSLLWQIPQYVTITAGEVLYSVTGLSFVYSQVMLSTV